MLICFPVKGTRELLDIVDKSYNLVCVTLVVYFN